MPNAPVFFPTPGLENTDETLRFAAKAAHAQGIDTLILASNTGYTATRAMELCPGFKLIVVGYKRSLFDPEIEAQLVAAGHPKVVFGFDEIKYDYPSALENHYRTMAGDGGKVAPEVVAIAVIAGLFLAGQPAVGIGGTNPGADTAFVVTSAREIADISLEEIVCQPRCGVLSNMD